jgi:hypothetical protein
LPRRSLMLGPGVVYLPVGSISLPRSIGGLAARAITGLAHAVRYARRFGTILAIFVLGKIFGLWCHNLVFGRSIAT